MILLEMEYLGYVAAFLTTYSFLPQVIKVVKTRKTEDLSLVMFSCFTMGILCWLAYGLYKDNLPMILANAITLVLSSIILGYKLTEKKAS